MQIKLSTVAVELTKTSARLMTIAPAHAEAIASEAEAMLTELAAEAQKNTNAARIAAQILEVAPDHEESGEVRIRKGLGEENDRTEIYDRQAKERQKARKGNQPGASVENLPQLETGKSRDIVGKLVGDATDAP